MVGQLDGAHHLRAAPRYKLFQPTEMSGADGARRVHLLNLSTSGALVHAAEAPAPGTSLTIRCGGNLLSAKVAWTLGRKFGVSFSTPLARAQVEQVLGDQQALIASASRRIGSIA